jgi:hypothetical protein
MHNRGANVLGSTRTSLVSYWKITCPRSPRACFDDATDVRKPLFLKESQNPRARVYKYTAAPIGRAVPIYICWRDCLWPKRRPSHRPGYSANPSRGARVRAAADSTRPRPRSLNLSTRTTTMKPFAIAWLREEDWPRGQALGDTNKTAASRGEDRQAHCRKRQREARLMASSNFRVGENRRAGKRAVRGRQGRRGGVAGWQSLHQLARGYGVLDQRLKPGRQARLGPAA